MSNIGWTVGLAGLAALGAGSAAFGFTRAESSKDTSLKVISGGALVMAGLDGTFAMLSAGDGIKSNGFKGLAIQLGISTAIVGSIMGATLLGKQLG